MVKQRIQSISIKNPCSENWDDMEDVANGRFCNKCQKNVVDFTSLSSNEILQGISCIGHICGRFERDQLKQLNYKLQQSQRSIFSWKKFSVAAALFGMIPFVKAQAKISVKTEQIPFQGKDIALCTDTVFKTISGTIIGNDDKLPIPGTLIRVKGTNIGTESSISGKYKIDIPTGHDTLIFKFIGYETQEIKIDKSNTGLVNVALKIDSALNLNSGDIVAGGVYVRRSFFNRIWYAIIHPIKSIFNH